MNQVEKILSRYLVRSAQGPDYARRLCPSEIVRIRPQHIMSHDNTAAIIPKFESLASPARMADPTQPVFALDHDIQNQSNYTDKYARIQAFADQHRVDFYPAGRGIAHQVMIEEAYALPGRMIVAPDSHSNMYGGLACLGTPLTRTDTAVIWATSSTWWKVPRVTRLELCGRLPAGTTGKDLILTLCSTFADNQVLNHIVEFSGADSIASLSIDDRLTIANMTTEWGCLGGLFPVDDVLLEWLQRRARYLEDRGPSGVVSDRDQRSAYRHPRLNDEFLSSLDPDAINADDDARYDLTLSLDLETVSPFVTGPNLTSHGSPMSNLQYQKIPIQKAYLVSCVNARNQDLRQAADIVRGKKVAEGVEFYVAPASSEVRDRAQADGSWQALVESGAKFLPAGCGPCIGLGVGLLKDGEIGISATNRNFKGRMGSRSAQCYLANPAIVAASAIAGRIVGPQLYPDAGPVRHSAHANRSPSIAAKPSLIAGFAHHLTGPILFLDNDNINTDAIYPGKYTYRDDLSAQQMASVALENYPATAPVTIPSGAIVVAGHNFGCGSSREQAATCLIHARVQAVIAASVNETYQRNAFNNGLLVVQCPDLIRHLRQHPSLATTSTIEIDFSSWTLVIDDRTASVAFDLEPIGEVGQQLIVDGGIARSVRQKLNRPSLVC